MVFVGYCWKCFKIGFDKRSEIDCGCLIMKNDDLIENGFENKVNNKMFYINILF